MTKIELQNVHELKERVSQSRHVLIAIDGPMSSGKSTLMQELMHYWPEVKFIDEIFIDNPHMAQAYNNPKEYGFPSQIHQLGNKGWSLLEVGKVLEENPAVCVSPYNDKSYAEDYLDKNMLTTYMLIFNLLVEGKVIPKPDVIIKLIVRDEVLIERVHKRDRNIERPVKDEFLVKLNELMDKNSKKSGVPIIEIDSEYYDFRNKKRMDELVESLEQQIYHKLKNKFTDPSSGIKLPPFIERKGVWV